MHNAILSSDGSFKTLSCRVIFLDPRKDKIILKVFALLVQDLKLAFFSIYKIPFLTLKGCLVGFEAHFKHCMASISFVY
jgi:hypothetical protein